MKLLSFRIKNYKSIIDTGEIRILDNITILVGKNESGKTNIIEAFDFLSTSQVFFEKPDESFPLKKFETDLNISIEQESENSIDHFQFILNTKLEKNEIEASFDSTQEELEITFILTIKHGDFKRITKVKSDDVFDLNKKNILPKKESARLWDFFYKKINIEKPSYLSKKINDIERLIKIPIKIQEQFTPMNDIPSADLPDIWTLLLDSLCGNKLFELHKLNINSNGTSPAEKDEIFKKMDVILEEINSIFKEAFLNDTGLKNFLLAIKFHPNGRSWLTIGFVEESKKNKKFFSIDKRSAGAKSFLNIWINIRFWLANSSHQQRIILFDEPDSHLHESFQIKFLKLLDRLDKEKCTVIFSTHSTVLPAYDKPNRICIVRRDEENGTIVENWPILKKLGYGPETINEIIGSATAYSIHNWTTKNNLIVEGLTDVLYLNKIKDVIVDSFNGVEKEILQQLNIIKTNGTSKIVPYVEILSSWGCNLVVLFDYDSGGFDGTRLLLNSKNLKITENKFVYTKVRDPDQSFETFLSEMAREEKKFTIENLFSKSDIAKFLTLKEIEEKYENAKNLYINFTNEKLELTDETKKNFEALFRRILKCFETKK